jgi:hypothetical protein
MRKPGNLAGDCAVCNKWGALGKHHSKPLVPGYRREGPVWLICSSCHEALHARFSNLKLREMTLDQARIELGHHTELYTTAIDGCMPEHRERMIQVWSPTPWMLDVKVMDRRREIRRWCNRSLGPESSPIHGHNGNWREGGVIVNGKTWFGFKTEEMMKQFEAQFPNNQPANRHER